MAAAKKASESTETPAPKDDEKASESTETPAPKGHRVEKYKVTKPDGAKVTVTHNIDTGETSVSSK